MASLHALVYQSQATRPLETADLDALLLDARVNNQLANVTGTLIYGGQRFAQDLEVTHPDDGDLGIYDKFEPGPGGLHIEVQKVKHEARVHLDIETDDIDAEVARLEALGAKRVQHVRNRWWVMEAPTGHRFCVVPRDEDSTRGAPNRWP